MINIIAVPKAKVQEAMCNGNDLLKSRVFARVCFQGT